MVSNGLTVIDKSEESVKGNSYKCRHTYYQLIFVLLTNFHTQQQNHIKFCSLIFDGWWLHFIFIFVCIMPCIYSIINRNLLWLYSFICIRNRMCSLCHFQPMSLLTFYTIRTFPRVMSHNDCNDFFIHAPFCATPKYVSLK